MEFQYNYVSIVALGNFNPGILTPEFLIENCEFPKDLSIKKGQTSPIISMLDFGNIHFIAELERFQVLEKNILKPKKIKILKYFSKYFDILKYTPIKTIGINFNSTGINATKGILNKLDDCKMLMNHFEVSEFICTKKSKIFRDSAKGLSWKFIFMNSHGYKVQLSLNIENNNLVINHNFELSDFSADLMSKSKPIKEFDNLTKEHDKFLKFLSVRRKN